MRSLTGQTIHAWGGVPPVLHDLDKVLKVIRKNKAALSRWKNASVLLIDEGMVSLMTVFFFEFIYFSKVSMVDSFLFNRLGEIASRV